MPDPVLQSRNKTHILWLKVKIFLLGFLSIWGLFISDSLDSLIVKNSNNDDTNNKKQE